MQNPKIETENKELEIDFDKFDSWIMWETES